MGKTSDRVSVAALLPSVHAQHPEISLRHAQTVTATRKKVAEIDVSLLTLLAF
jgi:hypothetical protein